MRTVDHLEIGRLDSSSVRSALGDARDLAGNVVRAQESSSFGEVGAKRPLAVDEPAGKCGELIDILM